MPENASRNASFRAALEKVIDGERVVLASAIAKVRLLWALVLQVVNVIVIARGEGQQFLSSIIVTFMYLGLSIVVLRLLKTGKLVKRAGWIVPLVDMPLVAIGQILQTPKLPDPLMGMVNVPIMMAGLVVLSMLSLSPRVIAITAAMGLAPIITRGLFVHLTPPAFITSMVTYVGITALMLATVARMRGLVHTSRAQDLLGKYVLGPRIGLGGMAEVFEATYSPEGGFERRVAVKRILQSYASNATALALFRQEAEVGAMLAHPGVVQVLDFGQHQGTAFLAMEFIDGVSLRDLIHYHRAINEQMPIAVVVHIAWQITEALDYIHTRVNNTGRTLNLVHRDLNPPNIMLTHIGDAKLADFGIALIAGQERMTQEGVMRGKLGYAAPEQVVGSMYDGRADLFALGLTLHECLTGNRTFRAENDVELMRLVMEGPIAGPRVLRADVPEELDAVVMTLLERDLAKRTPSAYELRRKLIELPRELLDQQQGRKLLAALVQKTRTWLTSQPVEPDAKITSTTNRTDETQASLKQGLS